MSSLALRSRHCLIEDIKSLETKLSHLQERFDVIVDWIRSQYCEDFSGLPDLVIIALRGDQQSSRDTFSVEKIEHIKVEYDNSDDHLSTSDETETENRRTNLFVELDGEMLKNLESGPVSRLPIQPQKRKCRNFPATTVYEDRPSFALPFEGEVSVKCENEQLHDDIPIDGDFGDNEFNRRDCDPLTTVVRVVREKESKELISGTNKRVKKTPKHIQANREKGLILDVSEYKQMIESLPKERSACAVCKKEFSTSTQVRRHEREVHLTKEERNKLRILDSNLQVERKKNGESISTKCDICHLSFKNIESHKINHLPSDVIATVEGSRRPHYRCLKCDSLFSDKKKYSAHVKRHCKAEKSLESPNNAQHKHTLKLQTEKKFLCNQCGHSFNRKHTLEIHEKAVHANQRDFKCQFCEKVFVIEYLKNCHEKKHLGTSSVTCDLCGFSFTCKQILRKHIRGVHENHRPFKCQLCEKSFKTSHARNYHVNTHGNPNGRKRGLNKEVDPIKAAAKRRHCLTWKQNRVRMLTNLTAPENENSNPTDAEITKD